MKDKGKILTVINTSKKVSDVNTVKETVFVGGGGGSMSSGGKSYWEFRKAEDGTAYLWSKYPVLTQYGITMYANMDNMEAPQIVDAIPFDEKTIWLNPDTGLVELKEGAVDTSTTLGKLTNVGTWADSTPTADRIMVQKAGSSLWSSLDLSEVASFKNVTDSGDGNAYTSIVISDDKKSLELVKGETFAKQTEFESLKTKVTDFLEGSDTDSIINKWKELETFLSGLEESDNLAEILSNKADKTEVGSTLKNYLKLSGGTMTGNINLYGTPRAWKDGRTEAALKFNSLSAINGSGYYPILAMKSNAGNVANLSGYINNFGFYGYFAADSGSYYDWNFTVNTNTGNWNCSHSITAKRGFVGDLTGNAETATQLKTARSLWGNSFDGTKDISGTISFDDLNYYHIGTYTNGLELSTYSLFQLLQNDTARMSMDASGNFTFTKKVTANSFSVNGIGISKSSNGYLYIDGDVVVNGGIVMYGTDGVSAPDVMSFLTLDPDTLEINSNGELTVVGGTGGASSWSELTGKPSYLGTSGLANSLTIQANGTSVGSYNGSSAKTINISYSNLGLDERYLKLTGGVMVKGAGIYNYSDQGDYGAIGFNTNENSFGSLTFPTHIRSSKEVTVKVGESGTIRTLIHSGNYTDYSPILNSSNTHATSSSVIYAPTSSGTSGYVLKSNGSGAPTWTAQSNLSVGSATKATQDGNGDTISSTYLKLSGGTMTGNLTLTDGSTYIASTLGSLLLGFSNYTTAFTGVKDIQTTVVGSVSYATTIRSLKDDLYHYNATNDKRYRILDTGNFPIQWTAKVYGSTWSRLCHVAIANSTVGSKFLVNIAGTRSGVVYNDTFLVTAHHYMSGEITKLSGSRYISGYKVRLITDSTGNCYFELYDSMASISTSTLQYVYCRIVPVYCGTVTTYTSFTSGASLPSSYAVADTLTVRMTNLAGDLCCSKIVAESDTITMNGDVLATGGITMYSDITKKNIINEELISVDKIANAPSFLYTFKDDEQKLVHLGSSAQYWQSINEDFVKDNDGTLSMGYGNIALTCAISISKVVVSLQNRIKELESEIEQLKN